MHEQPCIRPHGSGDCSQCLTFTHSLVIVLLDAGLGMCQAEDVAADRVGGVCLALAKHPPTVSALEALLVVPRLLDLGGEHG